MAQHNIIQMKSRRQPDAGDSKDPFRIIDIKAVPCAVKARRGDGQETQVGGMLLRFEFLDREPSNLVVANQKEQRGQHNVQFTIGKSTTGAQFVQMLRAIADGAEKYLEVNEREPDHGETQGSDATAQAGALPTGEPDPKAEQPDPPAEPEPQPKSEE